MIGGYGSDRAFEYNENVRDNVSSFPVKMQFCQGFVRELPRMSHAHDYAGCGSFEFNNETVKYAVKLIKIFFYLTYCIVHSQVLMAIGAYNSDKAEMYTESAGWTQVQDVPHKIVFVQNNVAVIDNVLYVMGGRHDSDWRKGILST